jgi:hypothetical protein
MVIGNDRIPYRVFAKLLMRKDSNRRLFRLGRIVWRKGNPGTGDGYSASVSLAVHPIIFAYNRECFGWILTVAGMRMHHKKSYGGYIT